MRASRPGLPRRLLRRAGHRFGSRGRAIVRLSGITTTAAFISERGPDHLSMINPAGNVRIGPSVALPDHTSVRAAGQSSSSPLNNAPVARI